MYPWQCLSIIYFIQQNVSKMWLFIQIAWKWKKHQILVWFICREQVRDGDCHWFCEQQSEQAQNQWSAHSNSSTTAEITVTVTFSRNLLIQAAEHAYSTREAAIIQSIYLFEAQHILFIPNECTILFCNFYLKKMIFVKNLHLSQKITPRRVKENRRRCYRCI